MPTGTQSKAASSKSAQDAIALLKADHREVEELFAKFESSRGEASKRKIADQVCKALTVHAQIEEEIFYPACREGGVEEDLMNEADVEHAGAKKLIAEIESGSSADPHWEAKVKVLSEQIEHHVGEEEDRNGMFAQAKKAGLDFDALGARMKERKMALMAMTDKPMTQPMGQAKPRAAMK